MIRWFKYPLIGWIPISCSDLRRINLVILPGQSIPRAGGVASVPDVSGGPPRTQRFEIIKILCGVLQPAPLKRNSDNPAGLT